MFIVVSLVPFAPWSPIYCVYKKKTNSQSRNVQKNLFCHTEITSNIKNYINQMKNEPHKEAQMESDLL